MYNIIQLNEKDNVAVAAMNIPPNSCIKKNLVSKDQIPFGHKIAISKIEKDSFVYKYGQIIGKSSKTIIPGEHVHSHNLSFTEFKREIKIQKNNTNNNQIDKNFFLMDLKDLMVNQALETMLDYSVL